MNAMLPADMLEATRLTREGRLAEAAALLQRRLNPGPATSPTAAADTATATKAPSWPGARRPRTLDVDPETGTATPAAPNPADAAKPAMPAGPAMPQALRDMMQRLKGGGLDGLAGKAAAEPLLKGAQFLAQSFSAEAGTRGYKLYVPSSYTGSAMPLVVMLHGCTQSPDDFAAGTRMNELAEAQGVLVAYPAQPASANAQKCWNWFSPGDQRRDGGEPALIAGITRQVMRSHAVDPRRVYVAGLSAGGAAAAILGLAYPDLYAAVGVHSGLACGAARDMPSAFAAMRQGSPGASAAATLVPTIVFHADQDTTVNPRNGDQVIAQAKAAAAVGLRPEVEHGQVPGGHRYSRTRHCDAGGQAMLEQWVVHGGGHAWSGGSPAGSYTDPRGPDASAEMLRFFGNHPRPMAE